MRITLSLLARGQFQYWNRYVERVMQKEYLSRQWHPLAGWKETKKTDWQYNEHRPWTTEFLRANKQKKGTRVFVEPIQEWKIFKGDRVTCGRANQIRCYFHTSTTMADRPEVGEGHILGLGNPLLDITVIANEEFLKKYALKRNDAIIADRNHMTLSDHIMKDFSPKFQAGGAAQNSIRIAQWILQKPKATAFFGSVGCDEQAQILLRKAQEAGVDVHYFTSTNAPTGTCCAVITGEDRSLVAHLGAANYFSDEWLQKPEQWKLVEAATVFYISGFVVPVCPQSIFSIAKHAHEQGKVLVMNLSASFLCSYFANEVQNIMQYIDVLFGNETEAASFCELKGITGQTLEEMALATAKLYKLNTKRERLVIFTQGKEPIVVASSSGLVRTFSVPEVKREFIKDTTGCGDAFVGGFLAQFVLNKPLEQCIQCGIYASHIVLNHWGCNYPDKPHQDFHVPEEYYTAETVIASKNK